jgi:hypothetical protein
VRALRGHLTPGGALHDANGSHGRLDKADNLVERLLDLNGAEERLVLYMRFYRGEMDQLLKSKQSAGKDWHDKVRPSSPPHRIDQD